MAHHEVKKQSEVDISALDLYCSQKAVRDGTDK